MKIIIVIILGIKIMVGCKNAEPAIYILPANYEGIFAVVYSRNEGEDLLIVNGRRQFQIPANGILLTKARYSSGWRDDIFLRKTKEGYDTLKIYLPAMDSSGNKFDASYYKNYTNDGDEFAVNNRNIVNVTFNNVDSLMREVDNCSFQYELITIGRASSLNDSLGRDFISKLDQYLEKNICRKGSD